MLCYFLCAEVGKNSKWGGLIVTLVVISPCDATVCFIPGFTTTSWVKCRKDYGIRELLTVTWTTHPTFLSYVGRLEKLMKLISHEAGIKHGLQDGIFLWENIQRANLQLFFNYFTNREKIDFLKYRQESKRCQCFLVISILITWVVISLISCIMTKNVHYLKKCLLCWILENVI